MRRSRPRSCAVGSTRVALTLEQALRGEQPPVLTRAEWDVMAEASQAYHDDLVLQAIARRHRLGYGWAR
jgi:hypothetical protein